MVNKDYLLRLAERFGRSLAIVLRLREYDKHEEALIYIDDLLLSMVGLTSRFINSISEEMLVKALSPLGTLNIEASLWVATMLKAEGEIYEELDNTTESYYRYLKALYLFLEVIRQEPIENDSGIYSDVRELLHNLEDYELPAHLKQKLFTYYEHAGLYAKAEDVLFELLETSSPQHTLIEEGEAFYQRLLTKHNVDLQIGGLSREEVHEGLTQLHEYEK